MYSYAPATHIDYARCMQSGGGYRNPYIQTFRGSRYQRGYGLGSLFSSFIRVLTPIFRSQRVQNIAKTAKRQALHAGSDILSDLAAGEDFGQTLKQRLSEHGKEFAGKAAKTVLTGRGRKRNYNNLLAIRKAPRKYKRRRKTVAKKTKRRKKQLGRGDLFD